MAVCSWPSQVYLRKSRMLLALSAVKRAAALAGPSHPEVHTMIVRSETYSQTIMCLRGNLIHSSPFFIHDLSSRGLMTQ